MQRTVPALPRTFSRSFLRAQPWVVAVALTVAAIVTNRLLSDPIARDIAYNVWSSLAALLVFAGMQLGALRSKAKKALETTGARHDVVIDDDDGSGTPMVSLSNVLDLAPGSQAKLAATGLFGAKTTFTRPSRDALRRSRCASAD